MRFTLAFLAVCLATVAAVPENPQRIVGGGIALITRYPFGAALLYSRDGVTYSQACAGAIINSRSILTAAHCVVGDATNRWRFRVGSSFASRGGIVYNTQSIITHPSYDARTHDSDIALLQGPYTFPTTSASIRPASIAGENYNLVHSQSVTAIGWGATCEGCGRSEQLRQVQIWYANLNVCRRRYAELGVNITDNMLCAGFLDFGGRGQCQGDDGGPLIHNNVIIGVSSWGEGCGSGLYPAVNTRVSRFAAWIQSNA